MFSHDGPALRIIGILGKQIEFVQVIEKQICQICANNPFRRARNYLISLEVRLRCFIFTGPAEA